MPHECTIEARGASGRAPKEPDASQAPRSVTRMPGEWGTGSPRPQLGPLGASSRARHLTFRRPTWGTRSRPSWPGRGVAPGRPGALGRACNCSVPLLACWDAARVGHATIPPPEWGTKSRPGRESSGRPHCHAPATRRPISIQGATQCPTPCACSSTHPRCATRCPKRDLMPHDRARDLMPHDFRVAVVVESSVNLTIEPQEDSLHDPRGVGCSERPSRLIHDHFVTSRASDRDSRDTVPAALNLVLFEAAIASVLALRTTGFTGVVCQGEVQGKLSTGCGSLNSCGFGGVGGAWARDWMPQKRDLAPHFRATRRPTRRVRVVETGGASGRAPLWGRNRGEKADFGAFGRALAPWGGREGARLSRLALPPEGQLPARFRHC